MQRAQSARWEKQRDLSYALGANYEQHEAMDARMDASQLANSRIFSEVTPLSN